MLRNVANGFVLETTDRRVTPANRTQRLFHPPSLIGNHTDEPAH